VFIADSSQPRFSFSSGSAWETGYSCVSAYFVAGRAAGSTPNVYADSLYTDRTTIPPRSGGRRRWERLTAQQIREVFHEGREDPDAHVGHRRREGWGSPQVEPLS